MHLCALWRSSRGSRIADFVDNRVGHPTQHSSISAIDYMYRRLRTFALCSILSPSDAASAFSRRPGAWPHATRMSNRAEDRLVNSKCGMTLNIRKAEAVRNVV